MTTTINLHGVALMPTVKALGPTQYSGRFLVLNFTDDCSVILPGDDTDAVNTARALAECLAKAADHLALTLAVEPQTEAA